MKNILVLHYSQSGQLTDIVNNIVGPIKNTETTITYFNIEMEKSFPFPWTKTLFFDVFPETFLQIPQKTKPIPETILNNTYDLIIFGYSVWYLTPSLPTTSFLNSPQAINLFKNTPVVTVIGCRNMWIIAQEKIKKQLIDLNSKLVGNIVLVDRHINHISVITIVQWMFTGVKKRFLGIFPKPGVSQKDIDESVKFGHVIVQHLQSGDYTKLQDNLLQEKAVTIKPFLALADKRANVLFNKWANFIYSKSLKNPNKKEFLLKLFKFYLLFAIWVIAPIVFILFLLTYIPLMGKIKKDKAYYSSVAYKS